MSSIPEFIAAAQKADPTLQNGASFDQTEAMAKDIKALDAKLTPVVYLDGASPTTADVSLYCHLHPTMAVAPVEQHPAHPSVLRYFLHVQSLPAVSSASASLPNSFPPLDIDVAGLALPPRTAIAPVKKEKKKAAAPPAAEGVLATASAAASSVSDAVTSAAGSAVAAVTAAVGGTAPVKEKKAKKEKAPAPAKAEPAAPTPGAIQFIVGKVVAVSKHPDADSLYVEQIDVGEETPRTICSGLVNYMAESDILDTTLIVVANLKPVSMRGIKSAGMVLCASAKDGKDGGIEFVSPPAGSLPGDRVYFEGPEYENITPEAVLNPKKKIWEAFQPGFSTNEQYEAIWTNPETGSVHRFMTKNGALKSKSLIGASLS